MTVTATVANRQRELEQQHQSYVRATVVRTQHPTSARAGDVAVVDARGTMTGFVGGSCVEASVRQFSLHALEAGEPVLLKVRPGDVGQTQHEGAIEVHNPCLSGGSIDVFLEPVIPAAHVVVVGDAPVAQSLATLGADLGFEIELVDGESWQPSDGDAAVIVASHGRGEEMALERALGAGVPYVGLVASEKRGAAVVASLNVDDVLRRRVHTPAGLRLGGTVPAEIALGILAELVQLRAMGGSPHSDIVAGDGEHDDHDEHGGHGGHEGQVRGGASSLRMVTDPVCGMTVVAADPTLHVTHGEMTVWFCSDGCRAHFVKDPERYAEA
jgi:xanthine dehydrogenase accessory factor